MQQSAVMKTEAQAAATEHMGPPFYHPWYDYEVRPRAGFWHVARTNAGNGELLLQLGRAGGNGEDRVGPLAQ